MAVYFTFSIFSVLKKYRKNRRYDNSFNCHPHFLDRNAKGTKNTNFFRVPLCLQQHIPVKRIISIFFSINFIFVSIFPFFFSFKLFSVCTGWKYKKIKFTNGIFLDVTVYFDFKNINIHY